MLLEQNSLSNPQLQEQAMLDLLEHNKEKLQKYIDIFDGETVNGMYISESGILMPHILEDRVQ